MEITRGKVLKAQKIVLHGIEGIGKTCFAANMPGALFIDTEGSTEKYDVVRTPKPTSWQMLLDTIKEVTQKRLCQSLIIDTIDWAEKLCVQAICSKNQKTGIEQFGYGSGYVYVQEEFGRLLNLLDETINAGIHVFLNAHSATRKFDQPDEMGSYDRWELKLISTPKCSISAMVKEWADMVLFANFKTIAVAADENGKKHKAQGGRRVMYTQHHPCWDAKNRDGLPDEVPFDFSVIAPIIYANTPGAAPATPPPVQTQQPTTQPPQQAPLKQPAPQQTIAPQQVQTAPPAAQNVQQAPAKNQQVAPAPEQIDMTGFVDIPTEIVIPENLPGPLKDLMNSNKVSEEEIRTVVAQKGYFPEDTPITNYPPDFINGCLIAAWGSVFELIKTNRSVPF